MAQSQEEWFQKLKQMVPSWVFERDVFNVAKFQGLAKILEQAQLKYEEHISNTYICQAEDEFLDIHGDERSIKRLSADTNSTYQQKIKNILNKSSCPELKLLVDALLISGESSFIEGFNSQNFFTRSSFFNRNVISSDYDYDAFTVIVDKQIPEPVTFATRENFYSREDIYGSSVSVDSVFENIVQIINDNKAFGTVYRLIERGAS